MKTPLRRVAAFAVDYIVIALWMGALFLFASRIDVVAYSAEFSSAERWGLQLRAFLILTLPVLIYFTATEASNLRATLGKKVMGLRVNGAKPAIIWRNILKFLPWELAHTGIWHGMPTPLASEPTGLGWTLIIGAQVLAAIYVIGLFIGEGRPLYDRLSGTSVVVKRA